jgi:uncharacterized membrane-anchored protein
VNALNLNEHTARDMIQGEIHARPIPLLEANMRVRRLVLVLDEGAADMAKILKNFQNFCAGQGIGRVNIEARLHSFSGGENEVTWEFHSEFVTVTWYGGPKDINIWPTDIGLHLLDRAGLLSATRIDMIGGSEVPDRLLPGFIANSLCLVSVQQGAGQVATDFVLDANKFLRFEFACGSLSPLRCTIMVRRLLEIETYRNVALLGLPLARQLSPLLQKAEAELTAVVDTLAAANTVELVQSALNSLHGLSVRAGQLSERLGYRFAASAAYGEIFWDRLNSLKEEPNARGVTISNYLRNRVKPTLSTFAAMEKRLNVLSQKIDRAIELLDVPISLDMQIQNKSVLESIAHTAKGQFLLQRTVEGLSTIAISYYLVGLIGDFLGGPFEKLNLAGLDKTLILSAATPFVLLFVWLTMRKIRKDNEKR